MCAYCGVLTASHSSVWGAQRPVGALEKKCPRKRTGAAPWPCGSRALQLHGSLGVVRSDWTGSSKRACRQGAAVGEIVFERYSRPKKRLTLPPHPAGHVFQAAAPCFHSSPASPGTNSAVLDSAWSLRDRLTSSLMRGTSRPEGPSTHLPSGD